MRRDPLTRCARGLGALLGVMGLAGLGVYVESERRLSRRYAVEPTPIPTLEGPAVLARGRHLAIAISQCAHCHGEDFGGERVADDWALGRLYAPNLTSGRGGIGASYSDLDFERAVRHGVDPRGRPLLLMPAQYLRAISDADLAAVVAYLRSLPAVDRETPARWVGPLTRLALVLGRAPGLLSAERIDHRSRPASAPPPADSVDYGRYLVELGNCRVCHHADLSGGLHALAVTGEPVPPDLTPQGRLVHWSRSDFIRALRSGSTPEGRRLNARYMPWPLLGQMNELEIGAIWRYLSALPLASPAVR